MAVRSPLAKEEAPCPQLDADFLNSNPDGSLSGRAAFLANIAKPCPVANLAGGDPHIRVLGDVGLVRARTRFTAPDGAEMTGRYTDLWMRRQGRWSCVAAHVTQA